MDYLDPSKERGYNIRLLVGYILLAVAILFGTIVLLYQAYGFGINKQGQVIQKGLVFLSSAPDRSQILLNGVLQKDQTNNKLNLTAGHYETEIRRTGYTSWKRPINVDGGSVQHYDYPQLFPTDLKTTNVKDYESSPGLYTQSPDRKWLIVQPTVSPLTFDLYDLSDPKNVAKSLKQFTLPSDIVTNAAAGSHSYKIVEWSTDNRRLVVSHSFTAANGEPASEYLQIDRQEPTASTNLTTDLKLAAGKVLSLRDKKYDRYYIYDPASLTLVTTDRAAAGETTPLLDHVLAYKTYGADQVLYMSDLGAAPGKVNSLLLEGSQSYRIREHAAGPPYLLDMARYDGDWYVVTGSSADSKTYVYKNPQQIRRASSTAVLVPIRIMRLNNTQALSFSANTQVIAIQDKGGSNFVTYDIDADKGYSYASALPVDATFGPAIWMGGHRLLFTSDNKISVIDHDNINGRQLVPQAAGYLPVFDRDYQTVYSLINKLTGGSSLEATSLLTPADQ